MKISKMKNKIYIHKDGPSTTLALSIRAGSRNESSQIRGIAHYIEHMVFKGTKKYTAYDISYNIEKYGAYFNAYTSDESTVYVITIANKYKNKAREILYDMVFNSVFSTRELNKEREVILQEYNMYYDNAMYYKFEIFNKNMFAPEDSSYTSALGEPETLLKINRKDILKFYNKFYCEDNLVEIIVGDIKDKIELSKKLRLDDYINKILFTDTYKLAEIHRKDLTQTKTVIGNIINIPYDRLTQSLIFCIIRSILNDMSGKLFTHVREKNNLAYSVYFDCDLMSDGRAIWYICVDHDRDKLDKAVQISTQQLKSLKRIDKKELNYARSKLIGNTARAFDNTYHIATEIAKCDRLDIDFNKIIYNYETEIDNVLKNFKDYINDIDFNKALVCCVSPKHWRVK